MIEKTVQYYIALITEIKQFDELTIKMLKTVCNDTFMRPTSMMIDDAEIHIYEGKDILYTLAYLCKNRGKKCFQQKLAFLMDLSAYKPE